MITDQLFAGETLSRRQKGIHRIELNVLATNAGARQFYAQQGFQVKGCACDAFYLNGQYVDDYSLAYLVPTVATAP